MATPIVAIVGRPNVGKSTLFNRIIKRREAIVDSIAGVTRDRHYANTDWSGNKFVLIDTGGYMIDYENDIDKGIRFHVKEAIDECDVVLFVTDNKTGITDIDIEIAKILRKSKRPVILVANKVDDQTQEIYATEFMRLGFGEPFMVSASHGRKVGDLLDEIVGKFPSAYDLEAEDDEIAIAILGRPNVGKSSIVNSLYGKEKMLVTDIAGTTRDSVDTIITRNEQRYRIIDTAGLRKKTKINEDLEYYSSLRTLKSLDRCHIVLVVVDVQEGIQNQDLKIIEMAMDARKGIMIILNKWDLIEKDDKTFKEYEEIARDRLKEADYIHIVTTSATTKQRLYKMLDLSKELFEEWNKRIDTSELNKVVQKIVEMNRPPAHRGRFISIKYATQVSSAPPVFTFYTNYPKGIPDNYRSYLVNKLRDNFGFKGIPITVVFKKK